MKIVNGIPDDMVFGLWATSFELGQRAFRGFAKDTRPLELGTVYEMRSLRGQIMSDRTRPEVCWRGMHCVPLTADTTGALRIPWTGVTRIHLVGVFGDVDHDERKCAGRYRIHYNVATIGTWCTSEGGVLEDARFSHSHTQRLLKILRDRYGFPLSKSNPRLVVRDELPYDVYMKGTEK